LSGEGNELVACFASGLTLLSYVEKSGFSRANPPSSHAART
jgi:hypothetical protein